MTRRETKDLRHIENWKMQIFLKKNSLFYVGV